MNRTHAYRGAVQENLDSGDADPTRGVTMGLFSYPILMAADILMFNARKVPVSGTGPSTWDSAAASPSFSHIWQVTVLRGRGRGRCRRARRARRPE